MLISTRGRYALRVMIDLAEHAAGNYIPLKEVAARQELSEKYLECIIKTLVRNDFLQGLRGKGGGYRLTRSPEGYTIGSILCLMEGTLSPISCLEPEAAPCKRAASCRTLPMWQNLNSMLTDFFDAITLADLLDADHPANDYII